MRIKRVVKFRKIRRKKTFNAVFMLIFLPFLCVLAGYLLTSVFILPVMGK